MCIGRVIEETGFFSIPSPPLTLIPWTELNPNTVPDFPCHPLLASRKTPDIHDYIIVAFPPCPEAGSGDGKIGLTLNCLYFKIIYSLIDMYKHQKVKINSKVIFRKAYIILIYTRCSYIQALHNISKT